MMRATLAILIVVALIGTCLWIVHPFLPATPGVAGGTGGVFRRWSRRKNSGAILTIRKMRKT